MMGSLSQGGALLRSTCPGLDEVWEGLGYILYVIASMCDLRPWGDVSRGNITIIQGKIYVISASWEQKMRFAPSMCKQSSLEGSSAKFEIQAEIPGAAGRHRTR